MSYKKSFIGGIVGAIAGFILGANIPSHVGVSISLLQRLTGNIIIEDPQGFVVSFGYALAGAVIAGAAGAILGEFLDKKNSPEDYTLNRFK